VLDLDAVDGFAIDLDGVVRLSGRPIPGAAEAIAAIRGSGRPVVFLTNDPRSTRDDYVERLRGIGIEAGRDDVLTAGAAIAEAVAAETPAARVYVVGSAGLCAELAEAGLEVVEGAATSPEAVVVGGHAGFDFEELREAMSAVRAGAALWATNRDPVYPTASGLQPGTGAIVAAVETATGRTARVAGKPDPAMFEAAWRHLSVARPAIVGDSLDSDIAGGAGAGFATILVLTGRAAQGDVDAAPLKPDLVLPNIAALAKRDA
jgi:HAD superfamily hydrolase (TIGR01450 family)